MNDEELHEIINQEVAGVGVGASFENTQELHTITFNKVMKSLYKKQWQEAIEEEYNKMNKYGVLKPVATTQVERNARIFLSEWVMKKKPNGTYRTRITAKEYEQIDGEHFDEHSIAVPMVDDLTIRIVLVLATMAGWLPQSVDVKGAFLHGEFEENTKCT